MNYFILVLMTFILSSCASLSEKATKLKITQVQDDVKNCTHVGRVQAGSSFGGNGGDVMIGNHNSRVKLLNMAAEYGDTILLVKDDAGLFGSDREGMVYRCLN